VYSLHFLWGIGASKYLQPNVKRELRRRRFRAISNCQVATQLVSTVSIVGGCT
jgi:hypothetical protein